MPAVTCATCGQDVGPEAFYVIGPGYGARPYCAACGRPRVLEPFPRHRDCRVCGRRRYYSGAEQWPHVYCSEDCERRARRERRRRPRAVLELPCAGCGRSFSASRRDARYCGPGCKQAAYRARRVLRLEW